MQSDAGRAVLLHALAHIEFNAINLALDAVWRFPSMPPDFYADWLKVAAEEAHHFSLLRARLAEFGHVYGDFPAHDGLWEMAERTRVDVLASSRHVEVSVKGVKVADSRQPRILFETGLPPRYYLPLSDVRMDLLVPSGTETHCPYKGKATYWSLRVGGELLPDLVWTYRTPFPEAKNNPAYEQPLHDRLRNPNGGQRRSIIRRPPPKPEPCVKHESRLEGSQTKPHARPSQCQARNPWISRERTKRPGRVRLLP